MLMVVYVASSQHLANALRQALAASGFMVSVRCLGSDSAGNHEVLVPMSEVEEAVESINQNLCRLGRVSR